MKVEGIESSQSLEANAVSKQRVLAAANVWSYPMAVDLSFREKRAP